MVETSFAMLKSLKYATMPSSKRILLGFISQWRINCSHSWCK